MQKPLVNVVVVTWNALEYTKATIDSLFANTKNDFYLTIVDNGSSQDTLDYLKSLEAKNYCRYLSRIYNEQNLGVSAAFNQGFAVSKEQNVDFTCLCNNDLYFKEDWLKSLLEEMQDTNIGMVAPLGVSSFTKYFKGDQSSREHFEAIDEQLNPLEELSVYFDNNIDSNMTRMCQINQATVFNNIPSFLPSHCVLIRNSVIKEIGFIADPRYKTYGSDDVDISWEILKRGYSLKITNKTFVYHFRHKSIQANSLNRNQELAISTKIFLKKWEKDIKQMLNQEDFYKNFFDFDNHSFSILRKMNSRYNFINQNSKIFACFGCLGKTFFAQKYPYLSIDLESTTFRYTYDDTPDNIEAIKGNPDRKNNPNFPNNYIKEIGDHFNRKAVILIALSEEALSKLDLAGIKYSIFYPNFIMKDELLERARQRGNSNYFIKKINTILSNSNELKMLYKNTRPKKIYFANKHDTVESLIKKHGILDNILLTNSNFTYKGITYDVKFKSLINKPVPDLPWCQVYAVGNCGGLVPVVKYNKKGKASTNLPGGGSEPGETYQQTLVREIKEELNMHVASFKPIGYQINTTPDGQKYYQLRVYANLKKIGSFQKDPGGSVIGYDLINIQDLNAHIHWGEVGDWFSFILQEKYGK